MTKLTLEELNFLHQALDAVLKANGLPIAAKVIPLAEKLNVMAAELARPVAETVEG